MRLLLVNSAWPQSWGGGEKWTIEAAQWCAEHGYDVCVVGRSQSRLIAAARGRELLVAETPFGGDFDPTAVWRARGIIARHRPDAVIVNFNKEAWHFGLAAKMTRIPVIARHGFPVLRAAPHQRVLANRVLTRIVVNAPAIREHYQSLGFSVERMDVVLNGVSASPQRTGELRRRYQIPEGIPLVVGCGRLESQKRFDLFIEAAVRIKQGVPQARFLIFGEGPLKSELEVLIREKGLSNQLRLAGFAEDFAGIVGGADLFLLTSENEGTPNALLEAMSAGVASLAFEVGAVPEVFAGDLVHSVLRFGDLKGLVERAIFLLTDGKARQAIAEACRLRIATEFSWDHSLMKFMKIIENCR